MTKKVAVIGYPIKHSKSPEIHNYWIKQCGIDAVYEKKEVKPEELEDFLENMQKNGYVGCNVTVPHKESVFEYIKKHGKLTENSKKIGAVNTVYFEGGVIFGENTDAFGFVENVKKYNESKFDFENKTCLVLGAGGAARAVVYGILNDGSSKVILTNRTREKAEKLKSEMGEIADKIEVVEWDKKEEYLKDVDFLVNTTSLGMDGQSPLEINLNNLPKNSVVTDIVYKPLITDLLKQAQDNGNEIVDGLGMLLYQASLGFSIWFKEEVKASGKYPDVTQELRDLVLNS